MTQGAFLAAKRRGDKLIAGSVQMSKRLTKPALALASQNGEIIVTNGVAAANAALEVVEVCAGDGIICVGRALEVP